MAVAAWLLAIACAVAPDASRPAIGRSAVNDDPRQPAGRLGANVDAVFGDARARYPLGAQPRARGYAASFVFTAHAEAARGLRFALRAPFTVAEVLGPARALFLVTVAGNPELVTSHERKAGPRLVWFTRLGLAVPLAHGHVAPERDRIRNEAQRLADAVEGGVDPQLHAAGRLGVRPGAGLRYEHGRFAAMAALELPLLVHVRGVRDSTARVNAVGVVPIAVGRAAYRIWRPMFIGVRAWMIVHAVWPARTPSQPSRFHAVIEPEVAFRFARDHVLASVGFRVPLGDAFAGSSAVELHLGTAF